nr:hypothetical protein [Acidobacteriota bacterium]
LLIRSLPTQFETSSDAAASYGVPFIYDLGLQYWSGFPKDIGAVDVRATQAVAKRLLQIDRMVAVAVGDRAKIEPELRKLNIGVIELRDADAKVIGGAANGPGAGSPAKALPPR